MKAWYTSQYYDKTIEQSDKFHNNSMTHIKTTRQYHDIMAISNPDMMTVH